MNDGNGNGNPLPFPTPPSIESAVREHIDVVHQMQEFRREQDAFRREIRSLTSNLGRLADEQTATSLTVQRIEKGMGLVKKALNDVAAAITSLKSREASRD